MTKEELKNEIHEMDDLIASLASKVCNRTYKVSVLLSRYENKISDLEAKLKAADEVISNSFDDEYLKAWQAQIKANSFINCDPDKMKAHIKALEHYKSLKP
jgi:hypothetical protein